MLVTMNQIIITTCIQSIHLIIITLTVACVCLHLPDVYKTCKQVRLVTFLHVLYTNSLVHTVIR